MPDDFAPLSMDRLKQLADELRNGPTVVSMARELLAIRFLVQCIHGTKLGEFCEQCWQEVA